MRDALDRLLRDATLVTLALAIAAGWSLYQVANGISTLIATFLTQYPRESAIFEATHGWALTWDVGGRILSLGQLVFGLIELAFVLLVAALVTRRNSPAATSGRS